MNDERNERAERGTRLLSQHVRDCSECGGEPPPVEMAERLAAYVVTIDAAALSRRVLAAARPELARLASAWFWRRLAAAVLAALLPLPVVLALNAVLLAALHTWASALLPAALVSYLVGSYAALLLLLFASTYAAIPLVLAREAWSRGVEPEEAVA